MPILEREFVAERDMYLVGSTGAFDDSDPTSLTIYGGESYITKIFTNSGAVQVRNKIGHVFLPLPVKVEETASRETPSDRDVLDAGNSLDAHASLVFISQQVYEMLGDNSA